MGVLVVIIILVIAIAYQVYKQKELNKQREIQEAAARLNFEHELNKKAEQWIANPLFMQIANSVISYIDECLRIARAVKISCNEHDSLWIECNRSYVKVWNSYGRLNHIDRVILFREFGFEDLDGDGATVASLCLALMVYLQRKYQIMPEIVLSFSGQKSIAEFIHIHNGQLTCSLTTIDCDMTKIHPLLEKITIP